MLLKTLLLSIFIGFSLSSSCWADDFYLGDLIGASSLSIFELEMRETLLLPFCRYDKSKNRITDMPTCLKENGRPVNSDEKEITLALPGESLRNGYFTRFEKTALEDIDFKNEIGKTPSGLRLLKLFEQNEQNIRLRLFYHIEKSQSISSNTLTRERLKQQTQEHFGFTVAKNNKSIIGINAYQNKNEAFYTILHELYHLFDPEIKVNPSPKDLYLQELRAHLFELRVYIERQKLVPNDKYSDSPFHQQFVSKADGGEISVNWRDLSHYLWAHIFPDPKQNHFTFTSKKGTDFLRLGGKNDGEIASQVDSLLFNEVLLELFESELNKSKDEQNQETIVARLLYSLPKNKDWKRITQNAEIVKRMFIGFGKMFFEDYYYLIDLEKPVPLRTDRINDIVTGGPRPRDGGGQ